MGRSRSQQKNPNDKPRKIISITRDLDTKLHTSENAWKAGPKKGPGGPQAEDGGGGGGDTAASYYIFLPPLLSTTYKNFKAAMPTLQDFMKVKNLR